MTATMHDVEAKSSTSYKSTHSSRSSVMERAREYSRKIDENNRRAKSLERNSDVSSPESGATPRSQSAGRASNGHLQGNRVSTRERALASVRKESNELQVQPPGPSPAHHRRPVPATPKTPQSTRSGRSSRTSAEHTTGSSRTRDTVPSTSSRSRPSPSRSLRSRNEEEPHEAIVTPELLVDALSGHEDGLLAIAERLMEHYDSGYDVMGEAIIDAFADVQKLFQHVVEAAHMEGAAFEASRREEEIKDLRKKASEGQYMPEDTVEPTPPNAPSPGGPAGPARHDEFIDQDVKDCLSEAIRAGTPLRESNKHAECYELYERACQSASALLPVDSDHRGRLQLSIARADSMSPDRACAILRYAMDDVLRSGLRAGKTPLPDPSKRADVVLSKPKGHPSMNGSTGQAGVVQSSEEALASLVEEMKEILSAPVYEDTPLQHVARRFWAALADAQKTQMRNEERLEQNLGKLKGEFLLARAEWEEKLTVAHENVDIYKRKYTKMKEANGYMEEARTLSQRLVARSEEGGDHFVSNSDSTTQTSRSIPRGVESVASLGSGLANHARSLVGSFACSGINERTGGIIASEIAERREDESRYAGESEWGDRRGNHSAGRSGRNTVSNSRSAEDSRYDSDRGSTMSNSLGAQARPSLRSKKQQPRSFRERADM